ncbi:MAG: phospholipase D family protein [Prevotella sp.]|nr:phospholipase D family protein [Prevotella sp.]
METVIIGQGYNIEENSSVGKELIKQFESKIYDNFTCLVAFASYGGVSALTKYIEEGKAKGMKIKVVLGVDQKGTSKEALEEVLSWDVDARVYHTSSNNIFHPKVYLFENRDIFTLIVGSNNLTVPGLVQNIECSLLIKDTIDPSSVHDDFYRYWKGILEGTETHLYPLSQEFINGLFLDKVITSEEQRSKRYDDGAGKKEDSKKEAISFKNAAIQKFPDGFRPKRLVKVKQVNKTEEATNEIEKSVKIDSTVLIAEIPKAGSRWKQANFSQDVFEDFFGATKGDNSYKINLTNIKKDGTLGEVTESQSVTVQSKNYRFELRCDETNLPYPSGNDRPIGLFVKEDAQNYMYQVLMPSDDSYRKIKDYLYMETANQKGRKGLMRRHIVDVEAIHALYPELIV